jgi:hypothetical protein
MKLRRKLERQVARDLRGDRTEGVWLGVNRRHRPGLVLTCQEVAEHRGDWP